MPSGRACRLRVALERLADRQQVAIMLDRRIDPDSPVDAAVADTPLDLLPLRLAAGSDATLSYIGPVVYVGPRDGTANLSVVAAARREEARRLPPMSAAGTRGQRAGHWRGCRARAICSTSWRKKPV